MKFVDQRTGKPRIDRLILRLMKIPESTAIAIDLFDQCKRQRIQYRRDQQAALESALRANEYNKAKLPDVSLAIFHLFPCSDGQLLCKHRTCKGLERFDASIEGVKSHFTSEHCAHLTTGMRTSDWSKFNNDLEDEFHPDKIAWVLDPLLAKAKKHQLHWKTSCPSRKNKKEDLDRKRIKHYNFLHEYVRKRRQWAALQELRSEFALRNQHLQDLISQSNHPTLEYSMLDYDDPTDMLDTGILTSNSILYGIAPSSLKEVLAVINLSYSTATVMRRRGTPTSFNPSALDFVLWRRSVPKPHRPQFDVLVHLMHPEMHHEYDERIRIAPSPSDDAIFHFDSTTGDIFGHSELDQDFDFSSFENDTFHEFMDPEAFDEEASDFWRQFHTSSDAPNQERNEHQQLHLDSSEPTSPDLPNSHNDLDETLRNSVIFAMVLQFLMCRSTLELLGNAKEATLI